MADVIQQYYEKLMDLMFSPSGKIKVASDFHGKMGQIESILKNDNTALISTILEFMIHAGNVNYSFDTQNNNLNKLILNWSNNLNQNLNIDIPKGLRNFTEQYLRERFKSSMNVVRMRWENVDGFILPTKMWLMDGASIYVQNPKKSLNTNEYYFGKPDSKKSNILQTSANETILIRKPYNQWYDSYPIPYLAKKGTLYFALFKIKLLERIAEVINTAFPYQFFIKMGTEQLINQGKAPTEEDLKNMLKQFQNRKAEYDEHVYSKGLAGAFSADVNFQELIPSYNKVLDEKIMQPIDKNILSSMGMIELQGFSQNRAEMILNPKVLVEEVTEAVNDYTDFIQEVMDLIKEKNTGKYTINNDIDVSPGIIESFVTDEMRTLIRSFYDRGLVSMEDTLEDTTPLKFKTQIKKRDQERLNHLHVKMYPRVTMNVEPSGNPDTFPEDDDIPQDKKPGSPESKNYKNANEYIICQNCKENINYLEQPEVGMGYIKCPNCDKNIDQTGKCYNTCAEIDLLINPIKSIDELPIEIKKELNSTNAELFITSFNEGLKIGKQLKYDNYLLEKSSMEYAINKCFMNNSSTSNKSDDAIAEKFAEIVEKQYIEAPYTKDNYPAQIKNLPVGARTIWINTFNAIYNETHDEDKARQGAWKNVELKYKKVGNTWKKK